MVDVGSLPQEQRIAIARLSGTAYRHGAGRGTGDPVAALHAISTDPRLLGIAAAAYTVLPTGLDRRAAELLRAAGADEQVIAEHAGQVRYWRGLPTSPDQRRYPDSSGSSS